MKRYEPPASSDPQFWVAMASREPTTVYRFPDWEIYYGPSSSLELHLPSPLFTPGQFALRRFRDLYRFWFF